MIILTGNDLKSGDVLWWAGGERWSRRIEDAVAVEGDADALIAREQQAQRVNDGYAVEARLVGGVALPLHIKDRVRASGPTVRQDLALNPALPITQAALEGAG